MYHADWKTGVELWEITMIFLKIFRALTATLTVIAVLGLFSQSIFAQEIGTVRNLRAEKHSLDVPSQIPRIKMIWDAPNSGLTPLGYYTLFNTSIEHQFNEYNSAEPNVQQVNDKEAYSSDYSGADDIAYYFHIAAFAFDNQDEEQIGPTLSYGPLRIDTVSPTNPLILLDAYTASRSIAMKIGVTGATEMFLSNVKYGDSGNWEPWVPNKQWILSEGEGKKTIYAEFRDRAGNIARTSNSTIYDTTRPTVLIETLATNPVRVYPINFMVLFSEPVTEFDSQDIILTNATLHNFSSIGQSETYTQFSIDLIPTTPGEFSMNIPENIAFDYAGNTNRESSPLTRIYDDSHPLIYPISEKTTPEGTLIGPIIVTIANSKTPDTISIKCQSLHQDIVPNDQIFINGGESSTSFLLAPDEIKELSLTLLPITDQFGSSPIQIILTDEFGYTTKVEFMLHVKAIPIISKISNTSVLEDQTKLVNMTIQDREGNPLRLTILSSNNSIVESNQIYLSGETIIGDTAPYTMNTQAQTAHPITVTITPLQNQNGETTISLIAQTVDDLTASSSFNLTVLPVNDQPDISPLKNVNTIEEQSLDIPVFLSDSDGDFITITATATPSYMIETITFTYSDNILTGNPIYFQTDRDHLSSCKLTILPAKDQFGSAEIRIHATDGQLVDEKKFMIIIQGQNDPPVLIANQSFELTENNSFPIVIGKIDANDADQNPLSFHILHVVPSNPFNMNNNTGDIVLLHALDFETQSQYTVTIAVSDSYYTITDDIVIRVKDENEPPEIKGTPLREILEDTLYKFIPSVIDPDRNEKVTFTIIGQPNWLQINPQTGEVSGTPENKHVGKTNAIQITVSDRYGVTDSLAPFDITVINVNDKPTLQYQILNQTAIENLPYSFTFPEDTFHDVDINDSLHYNAQLASGETLPKWLDFSLTTRTFSGTPLNDDVNIYTIKVIAFDNAFETAETQFTLTVEDRKNPPIINLNAISGTCTYTENNPYTRIAPFSTVQDNDHAHFGDGFIRVSFTRDGTIDDRLSLNVLSSDTDGISIKDYTKIYSSIHLLLGNFSGGTSGSDPLTISLTSNAKESDVQAILRHIVYQNESDDPVTQDRELNIILYDGDGGTGNATLKLRIQALNDNPIIFFNDEQPSGMTQLTDINEKTYFYFSKETEKYISIFDPDIGAGLISVRLNAELGTMTLNALHINQLTPLTGNGTKSLFFSGSKTAINAAIDGMAYYAPKYKKEGTIETITLSVTDNGYSGDGGGEYQTQLFKMNILEVPYPPVLSSLSHQEIPEDTSLSVAFWLSDANGDQILLSLESQNSNVIPKSLMQLSGPGLTHDNTFWYITPMEDVPSQLTLTIQPLPNQYAQNIGITILASDMTYTQTSQFNVTVEPVNDPPIAQTALFSMNEDTLLTNTLYGSDIENDALQFILVNSPQKGSIQLTNSSNGEFIYVPLPNQTGIDSFSYHIFDGKDYSEQKEVSIQINEVPDVPVISSIQDQAMVGTKSIPFTVNDPDGDIVMVTAISNNEMLLPNNITHIQIIGNGPTYLLKLTPMPDREGKATITIQAIDPTEQKSIEMFQVQIQKIDISAPQILFNETESIILIEMGSVYQESNYETSAWDAVDGDLTDKIEITKDINTTLPGIYYVTYFVSDKAQNETYKTRYVIVYDSPEKTISGSLVNQEGDLINFVDILIPELDIQIQSNYNGLFSFNIPDTGWPYYIFFSHLEYESQMIRMIDQIDWTDLPLIKKIIEPDQPSNYKLSGICQEHHSGIWIENAYIQAFTTKGQYITGTLSDNQGKFQIVMSANQFPCIFEAEKYGYQTRIFTEPEAKNLTLVKETAIHFSKPIHIDDKIEIQVTAEPPFYNDLNVRLTNKDTQTKIMKTTNTMYTIMHWPYESFNFTLEADTTEDGNAAKGYAFSRDLEITAVPESASVTISTQTVTVQNKKPIVIKSDSPQSDTFAYIPVGGIRGPNIPKTISYELSEYSNLSSQHIIGKFIELNLLSPFGQTIQSYNTDTETGALETICINLEYQSPVTEESLKNGSYYIAYADSADSLIHGKSTPYSGDLNISETSVMFCVDHLSAFGISEKQSSSVPLIGDDGGGGCFIDLIRK